MFFLSREEINLEQERLEMTSSMKADSLANWEDEEELGRSEPLNIPLPTPETRREDGAVALQASACNAKFCWLADTFLIETFEFSSSIREVNSSMRSFSVEICSDS